MEITNTELTRIFRILDVKPTNSGGHIRGWVSTDGHPLVPLHYSHAKPLNGWAAEQFRKSLYLDKREFEKLRKGEMTHDDYVKLVRDRVPDRGKS